MRWKLSASYPVCVAAAVGLFFSFEKCWRWCFALSALFVGGSASATLSPNLDGEIKSRPAAAPVEFSFTLALSLSGNTTCSRREQKVPHKLRRDSKKREGCKSRIRRSSTIKRQSTSGVNIGFSSVSKIPSPTTSRDAADRLARHSVKFSSSNAALSPRSTKSVGARGVGESSDVPAETGAVVIADGREQRETPERLGRLKKSDSIGRSTRSFTLSNRR